MKRRQALQVCAGMAVGPSATSLPFLQMETSGRGEWLPAFARRWKVAIDYSLKILDGMPEEDIGFQPIPEQEPFGGHFTHAGYWNAFYAGSITGKEPPAEPENPDRQVVKGYFLQTSQEVTAVFQSLEESELYDKPQNGKELWGKHVSYWKNHTVMDFLLRAYMHTTHHRAQAIVYLRLNGVEPPFFQF